MPLIDLTLSRLELDAALLGDGQPEAWVVVSPRYSVPLGESVLLRVRSEEAPSGVFIEGVVQWRRATPAGGEPAGVGVRVMTHSISRWRFLRRHEGATRERRASPRLPTRVAVILVTAPRGSTRIYPCSMTDVSDGGASLAMNHRLEPGEQGRCEWAVGARTFAVKFSVVWSSAGRLGIRLVEAQPASLSAWHELVETAAMALDARLLPPMPSRGSASVAIRTEVRTTSPPETPVSPRRTLTGLRPDRAVVEVEDGPRRRKDPRSG